MSSTLLIVDEAAFAEPFLTELASDGFDCDVAPDGQSALSRLEEHEYLLVLADVRMPSMGGREFCERAIAIRPQVPLVAISESEESAQEAIELGATDCLVKPITARTAARRLRRVEREFANRLDLQRLRRLLDEAGSFSGLVGQSEAMLRLFATLPRVARSDAPVLLVGARGTGKQRVARALHRESTRRSGPFVFVPCSDLPAALLEGDLLGPAALDGPLGEARGGTLFLADVDALPSEAQTQLARTNANHSRTAPQARIIAATRRTREGSADDASIRPELIGPGTSVSLELPPLRERETDVLLLARHFLDESAVRSGRHPRGIEPAAARRILEYEWPGNVRELRSVIERAVAVTSSESIREVDLPAALCRSRASELVLPAEHSDPLPTLDEIERSYIARVLAKVDGNKSAAARILGFDRRTLYRKLDRYDRRSDERKTLECFGPNTG